MLGASFLLRKMMLHLLFSTHIYCKQHHVNQVYTNNEFSNHTECTESRKTQQNAEFICIITERESVTVSEFSVLPI